MTQAFEAIMLICFGISWPFNIAKSLKSRTAKGKSLPFEICVVVGYLFGIAGKKDELAKNLPYGEQRKLEIARALAAGPSLLLLDEPAAGMNPQETDDLMQQIAFVRKEFALSILLIEHDMRLVMGICERLIVLDYGRIIAGGSPEEVRADPAVVKAYLGAADGTEGGSVC